VGGGGGGGGGGGVGGGVGGEGAGKLGGWAWGGSRGGGAEGALDRGRNGPEEHCVQRDTGVGSVDNHNELGESAGRVDLNKRSKRGGNNWAEEFMV